jgi:hypothetical protein
MEPLTTPRQRAAGLILLGVVLLLSAHLLVPNAYEPISVYSASPADEPKGNETVAFDSLSEPAQRGVERAVDADDSVTLRGERYRAPEFNYGDHGSYTTVQFEGRYYGDSTSDAGIVLLDEDILFTILILIGLVSGVAGAWTYRGD